MSPALSGHGYRMRLGLLRRARSGHATLCERLASSSSASTAFGTRLFTNSSLDSVDAEEIRRFGRLSSQWANEEDSFKALHSFNQIRVPWIVDSITKADPDQQVSAVFISNWFWHVVVFFCDVLLWWNGAVSMHLSNRQSFLQYTSKLTVNRDFSYLRTFLLRSITIVLRFWFLVDRVCLTASVFWIFFRNNVVKKCISNKMLCSVFFVVSVEMTGHKENYFRTQLRIII